MYKAVLKVNVENYQILHILIQKRQSGHKMDGTPSFQKLCQTVSITLQLILQNTTQLSLDLNQMVVDKSVPFVLQRKDGG